MTRHGQLYRSDHVPPHSTYYDRGRFGRLFPTLHAFASNSPSVRDNLFELGKPEGIMDANDPPPPTNPLAPTPGNPDNPNQTAGFTFLGQFLDHDITFDPTSSLERQVDPEAVNNFRTPALELDNVYGSRRGASPHLYDQTSPGGIKLLIDDEAPNDLPRNSQNTAIIGDPRNDENLIVSQLHLAFLKFHNAVIDWVLDSGVSSPNEAFDEAQRLVRRHYQWIILHEFLPATVGQGLVDDVLEKGRRFYNWRNEPFIPVEFSVAAYRFGHSQVRPGYIANFDGDNGNPFVEHIYQRRVGPQRTRSRRLIRRQARSTTVPRLADLLRRRHYAGVPWAARALAEAKQTNRHQALEPAVRSALYPTERAAVPCATQPAAPPHLRLAIRPAGGESDEG